MRMAARLGSTLNFKQQICQVRFFEEALSNKISRRKAWGIWKWMGYVARFGDGTHICIIFSRSPFLPPITKMLMDWVFSVHNLIIMEQLIISLRVPNPRTIFNKAVYWLSLCCKCQNLEISEHRRGNSRITVEWNRSRGQTAGVRRRAHFRARRQPTVSVGWTNDTNTDTNVAVWIEDVWIHSGE